MTTCTFGGKMAKLDTRTIGLDAGLAVIKYLTGKENLHYGIWDGLEPNAGNLGAAQEAYTKRLFTFLPKRKNMSILDIGGGAGETARKLADMGHTVEIVVPSAFLADRCRRKCGPDMPVHEMTFEDFGTDKTFDICLFSESFQYIPMELSVPKAVSLLNERGRIVIGDCFRTEAYYRDDKPGRVGGGWPFRKYENLIAEMDFEVEKLEDITASVAPSVQVEQDFFNVIGYAVSCLSDEMQSKKPFMYKVISRLVRTMIGPDRQARLMRRLQGNDRNPENFILLNRYILTRLKPKS